MRHLILIIHCLAILASFLLIESIFKIDALVLGIYFIIAIGSFWILIFFRTRFTGGNVDKASDFLRQIAQDEKEFCLVLRPFGKDGHIPLSNLDQGYMWERFLLNWLRDVTIEQVIENKTKKILKTDTVALVDPNLNFIPESPKYLKTDHKTWKWVLFDLLKYSLAVYIVIPPGETVRASLHWEVMKALQLGLLGRLAIILPPMDSANHKQALDSIKKNLSFLFPHFADLPADTIAIYPHDDRIRIEYWVARKIKKKLRWNFHRGKLKLPLRGYGTIVSEINKRIRTNIEGRSYVERHLHLHKDYAEFDFNFNPSDLEFFLRNPQNPFGFNK